MRRHARLGGALAGLLLVFGAYVALAPPALGGRVTYAFIRGASMRPALRQGDLVLIRPAPGYRIGDVVAYRLEGRIVLHRVVARDGSRYVLQGDANAWTDSARSEHSGIVGRLWLRMPGVGGVVGRATSPAGLVALALAAGAITVAVRRRRGASRRTGEGTPRRVASPSFRVMLPAAGALAVFSLAIGAVGFSHSSTRTVSEAIPYTHTGAFRYGAKVPGNDVYEGGHLRTGDPVFLRLVPRLDVGFEYRLDTLMPSAFAGTAALEARIRDDASGWTRTVEISPPVSFEGRAHLVTGVLDLAAVRALVGRVQSATFVNPGSYTLSLIARIRVRGRIAGREISDTFAPELPFRLDALTLAPAPTGGSPSDATRSVRAGAATSMRTQANRVAGIPVAAARAAAVAGLVVAALCAIAALGRRGARAGDRSAPWLLDVRLPGSVGTSPSVELPTMKSLVRVARACDRPVFHEQRGPVHSYLVWDGVVAYRFREASAHPIGAGEPAPASANGSPATTSAG